jgi:tryptophan halogenase
VSASPPLGRVAIFGSGVDAWMTAAALARATGGQAAIRVIETGPTPTGALSTLPSLRSFHALLGLDEAALMAATKATYKLGSRFSGWTPGQSFCQAFGEIGATLDGVGFRRARPRRWTTTTWPPSPRPWAGSRRPIPIRARRCRP